MIKEQRREKEGLKSRKRRNKMAPFTTGDIFIEVSPGLKKIIGDNELLDYVEDSIHTGNPIYRLNIPEIPADLKEIEDKIGFAIGKFPDKGDIQALWPKKDNDLF